MIDDEEDDKDHIPRGLVSQRRALFGTGDCLARSRTVPPPSPTSSSSSSCGRRSRSTSRPTQVNIIRYGVTGPAQLLSYPDENISPESRRITVTRHVTTHIDSDPHLVIEKSSHTASTIERRSTTKRSTTRTYPTVTVNVSDMPTFEKATTLNSERINDPPKDYLFRPIEIPIQRSYTNSPVKPQTNRTMQLERIDFCSTTASPRKSSVDYQNPSQCAPGARILFPVARPAQSDYAPVFETRPTKIHIKDRQQEPDYKTAYPRLTFNYNTLEQVKQELESEKHSSDEDERAVSRKQITEECNRMFNELQQNEQKENRIVSDKGHGDVDEEILSLKRQVASDMGVEMPPPATVLNNKQEISTRASEIPAADTSHIISLKDQSVMYTTGAVARQEALIGRLQKELTDVQSCNHFLNSQLTALRSSDGGQFKKELNETKVSLFIYI